MSPPSTSVPAARTAPSTAALDLFDPSRLASPLPLHGVATSHYTVYPSPAASGSASSPSPPCPTPPPSTLLFTSMAVTSSFAPPPAAPTTLSAAAYPTRPCPRSFVDYRRSPEHLHPASYEKVADALRWLLFSGLIAGLSAVFVASCDSAEGHAVGDGGGRGVPVAGLITIHPFLVRAAATLTPPDAARQAGATRVEVGQVASVSAADEAANLFRPRSPTAEEVGAEVFPSTRLLLLSPTSSLKTSPISEDGRAPAASETMPSLHATSLIIKSRIQYINIIQLILWKYYSTATIFWRSIRRKEHT